MADTRVVNELEDLFSWANAWGDVDKHSEAREGGNLTGWGEGYHQAMRDLYDRVQEALEGTSR